MIVFLPSSPVASYNNIGEQIGLVVVLLMFSFLWTSSYVIEFPIDLHQNLT